MTHDIACTWSAPGADRYTGTIPAAIAAYGLPIATQTELVRAWERREFTDSVVIDRDSIRGQNYDYAPQLRDMHFGSRGRVCSTVTRAAWTAEHVETAIVVCASDGECIAIPAVCGNVSRVTRSGAPRTAAGPAVDAVDADMVASVVPPLTDPAPNHARQPLGYAEPGLGYGPSPISYEPLPAAHGGFWIVTYPPMPAMPVAASPIPEPGIWALFGLGLAGLAFFKGYRA